MKKNIFLLMTCLLVTRAEAQLFSPESWNGTVLGGIAGGIIGHNSHGRTGEGIAIGAGAGWLLGTLAHQSRRQQGGYYSDYVYAGPPVNVGVAAPGVSAYYGGTPPYASPQPGYAWSGTVLGGIAGGIIGHNSHGQTAEGVAIGAASGLVLGSIADSQVRRSVPQRRPVARPAGPPVSAAPQSATSPQPPSPWQTTQPVAHQIPDAPRVPDAPTF